MKIVSRFGRRCRNRLFHYKKPSMTITTTAPLRVTDNDNENHCQIIIQPDYTSIRVSDPEARIFGSDQGPTRVFGEAYIGTPQPINPIRPARAKKTASGRTLEVISKIGFSFEIKAKPRLNPQAYACMSRT